MRLYRLRAAASEATWRPTARLLLSLVKDIKIVKSLRNRRRFELPPERWDPKGDQARGL